MEFVADALFNELNVDCRSFFMEFDDERAPAGSRRCGSSRRGSTWSSAW